MYIPVSPYDDTTNISAGVRKYILYLEIYVESNMPSSLEYS